MSKKEKKEKIVYVDDGSTVVDMTETTRGKNGQIRKKSTMKEKTKTYFATVRQMILPMLVTLTAFTLGYLLLRLAAGS